MVSHQRLVAKNRGDRGNDVTSTKMAAAMDVDTPSGTNSGASKKRFEVKKVRLYNGETCMRNKLNVLYTKEPKC